MKRFAHLSLLMSLLWFLYPDEAWCSGCKKCNQRAVELRQRLLEQQQEAEEPQSYDVSMTDWAQNSSASASKSEEGKKDKKKDKKKKKKKKKDDSSSSNQ